MPNEQDFKVFISWSGTLAKLIANALHAWLPTMFDYIDPWFSETDIPAGATWFGEILDRLNSSDYGIIVITTANLKQPWLNFEAGSLSKKLEDNKAVVTPVLVNFDRLTQLTGHPLQQYNAVMLDKDGIRSLCESIALSAERSVNDVLQRFEQLWGNLEVRIAAAKDAAEDQPAPPEVSQDQRLDALTASIGSLETIVGKLVRSQSHPLSLPRDDWTPPGEDVLMQELHAIVTAYRPIREITSATGPGGKRRVQLTLGGDTLSPDELKQLFSDASRLPVELMIRTTP